MGYPVVLSVSMEAKPDCVEQVKQILEEVGRSSREEEGCDIYQFLQHPKKPEQFMLLERWSNKETFEKHRDTPELAATFAKLEPLYARPATFEPWRTVD